MAFYAHDILHVTADLHLDDLFRLFQSKSIHIAVVQEVCADEGSDPYYTTVGIVTLEEILSAMIAEPVDEENEFVYATGEAPRRTLRQKPTPSQVVGITNFLQREFEMFSKLSKQGMYKILGYSTIQTFRPQGDERIYLYKRYKIYDFFAVIISGSVEIDVGEEDESTEKAEGGCLGLRALSTDHFVCDFNARVTSLSKVLTIPTIAFHEIEERSSNTMQ
jgi:hypothetical protein